MTALHPATNSILIMAEIGFLVSTGNNWIEWQFPIVWHNFFGIHGIKVKIYYSNVGYNKKRTNLHIRLFGAYLHTHMLLCHIKLVLCGNFFVHHHIQIRFSWISKRVWLRHLWTQRQNEVRNETMERLFIQHAQTTQYQTTHHINT